MFVVGGWGWGGGGGGEGRKFLYVTWSNVLGNPHACMWMCVLECLCVSVFPCLDVGVCLSAERDGLKIITCVQTFLYCRDFSLVRSSTGILSVSSFWHTQRTL